MRCLLVKKIGRTGRHGHRRGGKLIAIGLAPLDNKAFRGGETLQFRLEGSGQFSGSEPGDDKFAGADIDSSEASLRACGSNGNEIIVLPCGKQVGFGEGARGEDAGYRALDDTFTDFAYLVADGDFVAALNQFAHVIFQGMQGYAREGNPAVLSILAGGEDNL